MNVLMLSEDFYPKTSGGAFVDWKTAMKLTRSGDRVVVVTPRTDGTASVRQKNGVTIYRPYHGAPANVNPNSLTGQLSRITFVLLVLPYLVKLCWREDFDLIYSTNFLFHPLAWLLEIVFGIKHMSFVGYSPSLSESSVTDPLILLESLNFLLFMGECVVCRTPSTKKRLDHLSRATVKRLDGIVDEEVIRSVVSSADSNANNGDKRSVQLIFVGRLVEVKNPTKAIEVVERLPQRYSLLMIGDGPKRKSVEAAAEASSCSDRIEVAGGLSHRKTLKEIHDSDVLLLTSEVESYGAVVFEALCLNTPALATPVSVLPSIDHPRLVTTHVNEFSEVIPHLKTESSDGVHEESLTRYSVDRFTDGVRECMYSLNT